VTQAEHGDNWLMSSDPDGRDKEVVNRVDGIVPGNLVQANSLRGDVHLHHHDHGSVRSTAGLPCRSGVVPPRAMAFQPRGAPKLWPGSERDGNRRAPISVADAHTTVVSGLGGVGKTQLVADYAENQWESGAIDLLVWMMAGSREAVLSGYARVALDLFGTDSQDSEHGVTRTLAWLAGTKARWLIVLDDLRSPGDLRGLWPPGTATGRTVVTTRRRDAALRGHRRHLLEIDGFAPTEAQSYLHNALNNQPRLLDEVVELAVDLGHLPLALAQAAAYMLDRNLTCGAYRTRLLDRRRTFASLLPDGAELPDEHTATVAATWSLSLGQANQLDPSGLATPLLEIASLLNANGIPVNVFETPAVTTWASETVGRAVEADDVLDGLSCLQRLSLIDIDAEPSRVRVHALVQRVTRDSMTEDRLPSAVRAAADALQQVWPEAEQDGAVGQVLRSNTDALRQACEQFLWQPSGHHPVLCRAGISLGTNGLVALACDYFRLLSDSAVERLGSDHRDTLAAKHQAARWAAETGDPMNAVLLFEKLLSDRHRISGNDHPDTLGDRLALVYWRSKIGDAAESVVEFEQLLSDQQRVLGPEHHQVLDTRGNIAHLNGMAGDPVTAVTRYESLLTDLLRVLGPEHAVTLHIRRELARWRGETGDFTAAVAAMEVLLEEQHRLLGADHPHTLATRHELARLHGEAGDPASAVAQFASLLADLLRVLGPDHPRVRQTGDVLARWRVRAGQT
jgi:hypothetical protein